MAATQVNNTEDTKVKAALKSSIAKIGDNVHSNPDVPACIMIDTPLGQAGIIYCPPNVGDGTHDLRGQWPISKSSGKTRTGATTKGCKTMMLQPLGDTRMAEFTGAIRCSSTQAEIQAGRDAGIIDRPK
jgi:hypothetical protein